MKKEILSLAALLLLSAGSLQAQKDTLHLKEERIIQKRMKDGKPEKMVIVIDNGKITVNGEAVQDLKGKLNLNDNYNFDFGDMNAFAPQMKEMMKNMGPQMQQLRGFRMNTHSNKALLGVNVEKNDQGAKITEIVKESGAEKAGLQKDDIITSINADKISDGDVLIQTIGKYKPEEVVNITVLRNGKEKKFKATLGKNATETVNTFNWNSDALNLPDFSEESFGPRTFNFKNDHFRDIERNADRPKFGFDIKDNEDGDGVVVTEVKEATNASKAGLKENDIITEVAGTVVKNVDELKRLLDVNRTQSEINIKVLRNGKAQSLSLKVPKKIKTAEL